jgi:catechol 2,3-dioxygenase-like lactoylglutathione lyase family enzyme
MDWTLEVVLVPVGDIDRAKRFYGEQVGFAVDFDTDAGGGIRNVQLTPPGSACSIVLTTLNHTPTGQLRTPPGSAQGLQLVVSDVQAARAQLAERGVEVSEVVHFQDGAWAPGPGGAWNCFVFFNDPDGNGWLLQERPTDR